MARHAVSHLPVDGIAVDLCTGSGALAAFLQHARPRARVVASDIDAAAVACALANGIEAHLGDLFDPLPPALRGRVDVVVAVPPYVPDDMLALLPRDVARREPAHAPAGGTDGLDIVERIAAAAGGWLRPGGALVVEAGIDQVERVADRMEDHGPVVDRVVEKGDGDPCAVCATTS